jgi:type II secretory pathway component GspD/PulD (secretin)
LADLVHAKVWFSSSYDTKWKKVVSYAFFGQEDDLELVKYLYDVIDSAIEHETESFKSSDEYRASRRRKTATVSFGHGMASRISYRLRDLRRKNDAELRKAQEAMDQTFEAEVEAGVATTTQAPSAGKVRGTALVVLKGQLIDAEFKKEGVKLRKAYGSHRANDSEAYYKGHAAGDKVNLSRPIGGGSKNSGYLS